MKRSLPALLALALSANACAATVFVNVGGNAGLVFSPQTIVADVGDTVTFVNKGGLHNVVADDGSFRCARGCDGDGHNGNGNASNANWIASITLTTPGTIGYFCEIHGMPGVGMFGTLIVQGAPPPPPPPSTEEVPAAGAGLLAALVVALIACAARWRRRTR